MIKPRYVKLIRQVSDATGWPAEKSEGRLRVGNDSGTRLEVHDVTQCTGSETLVNLQVDGVPGVHVYDPDKAALQKIEKITVNHLGVHPTRLADEAGDHQVHVADADNFRLARDQKIITLALKHRWSSTAIGNHIGLSPRRVREIVAEARGDS